MKLSDEVERAVEGDLDVVLSNPVASTIPNSEVDAKLAPVNVGP
jgi:hypothetical protein